MSDEIIELIQWQEVTDATGRTIRIPYIEADPYFEAAVQAYVEAVQAYVEAAETTTNQWQSEGF